LNKTLRNLLIFLLCAALAVGGFFVIRRLLDYKHSKENYDAARVLAALPEELPAVPEPAPSMPETPEETSDSTQPSAPVPQEPQDPYIELLKTIDLSALQNANPDVVGWILIPDTVVSYPILQAENNRYYLRKNWLQEYSFVGSIFMECQNRTDLNQFNTLIYGHNMQDGSMFSNLKDYQDQEYWQEHPYIYIATAEQVKRYEVFAAYVAGTWEEAYSLELERFAPEHRQSFIDFSLKESEIDTGIVPTVDDSILTLSTCTGNGGAKSSVRWVVQAVCPAK